MAEKQLQFTFTDDVPKATRGRGPHQPTQEDEGVAALIARGNGAIALLTAPENMPKDRRKWTAAAKRAGRSVRTVYSAEAETLYVRLADSK